MVLAETPPNIVVRLQEEISRAQKHLALTEPIRVAGVEVPSGSGRQFEAHMKNETKRLTEVIRLSGAVLLRMVCREFKLLRGLWRRGRSYRCC